MLPVVRETAMEICDVIHGKFELTPVCAAFCRHPHFERLRHVRQMGSGWLVFSRWRRLVVRRVILPVATVVRGAFSLYRFCRVVVRVRRTYYGQGLGGRLGTVTGASPSAIS